MSCLFLFFSSFACFVWYTVVQLVLLSSVCSASYISTCHYAGSFCAYDGGDAARRDRAARAGFNISCGDSLSEGIEYCTGPTSRHRCRSVYSTLSGSTRRQLLVESSCITDADVNKCASELCIFSEPLLYVGSGSLPGVATRATSSCCCNVTDNCNAVGVAGTLPTEGLFLIRYRQVIIVCFFFEYHIL